MFIYLRCRSTGLRDRALRVHSTPPASTDTNKMQLKILQCSFNIDLPRGSTFEMQRRSQNQLGFVYWWDICTRLGLCLSFRIKLKMSNRP